jgi:hypothetical protein
VTAEKSLQMAPRDGLRHSTDGVWLPTSSLQALVAARSPLISGLTGAVRRPSSAPQRPNLTTPCLFRERRPRPVQRARKFTDPLTAAPNCVTNDTGDPTRQLRRIPYEVVQRNAQKSPDSAFSIIGIVHNRVGAVKRSITLANTHHPTLPLRQAMLYALVQRFFCSMP